MCAYNIKMEQCIVPLIFLSHLFKRECHAAKICGLETQPLWACFCKEVCHTLVFFARSSNLLSSWDVFRVAAKISPWYG